VIDQQRNEGKAVGKTPRSFEIAQSRFLEHVQAVGIASAVTAESATYREPNVNLKVGIAQALRKSGA
jgi:hypothetical protein